MNFYVNTPIFSQHELKHRFLSLIQNYFTKIIVVRLIKSKVNMITLRGIKCSKRRNFGEVLIVNMQQKTMFKNSNSAVKLDVFSEFAEVMRNSCRFRSEHPTEWRLHVSDDVAGPASEMELGLVDLCDGGE